RSYGDWSSDVCSSDLAVPAHEGGLQGSTCGVGFAGRGGKEGRGLMQEFVSGGDVVTRSGRSRSLEADIQIARSGRSPMHRVRPKIGRASCRERVWGGR